MRDRALEVVKRLGKTFGGFTPGQKAVTLLGIVALGIGGFVFAKWASAPTYTPLFSNLSSTDASAIVDKLNSSGTPYQLTNGGGTIMVPQAQVYDLRLKMSGQGLQNKSDDLAVKAATGSLTDVHDYMIASTEASLATQLTTAVSNKAVAAFNEIMRMQA